MATKKKVSWMTEEQASEVIAAGKPQLSDRLQQYRAECKYEFAERILAEGRANVIKAIEKSVSVRRRNGCGCDNAPDCLCPR